MGCHVRYSDRLGSYFGRKCTVAILVLTTFFMLAALTFTLVARVYMRAYYNGAHMAGLSFFIALSVLSFHLCKLQKAFTCSSKAYMTVRTILCIWALLCCLAASIAYSVLTGTLVHLNYDYLAALTFGWIDSVLLLYLLVVLLTTLCSSSHFSYDVDEYARDIAMYRVDYHGDDMNHDGSKSRSKKSSTSDVSSLRICCGVILGVIYTIFHILFALTLFLSAYHPASILDDVMRYKNASELYTVGVEGHRPMSLFVRCEGNGTETIVFENGLGGLALMEWDFMPRYMKSRYRVCVHDRRGYGWSDGFTYDYINTEQQWAENNVQFFRALIDQANIPTPFYYAGHSYGGIHLTYTAHKYPELIKGLIYLDTAKFSPVATLRYFMETINNFKPLGLMHIGTASGLLDPKVLFRGVIDFDHITPETTQTLMASMRSGYYLEAFQEETTTFVDTDFDGTTYQSIAAARLSEAMGDDVIGKPILVIDASSPRGDFPVEKFSEYDEVFHLGISGADHQTLVYGLPYIHIVSDIMDTFIKLTNGDINEETYKETVLNMTDVIMKDSSTNGNGLHADPLGPKER